jgi:hypothetical protein
MSLDSSAHTSTGRDDRIVRILAALFVLIGGLAGVVLLGGLLLKALVRSSGIRPGTTLLPW